MALNRSVRLGAAAIALAGVINVPALAAPSGVEAGLLVCKSVPGSRLNLFVYSRVDVDCTFRTTEGKVEQYKGKTGIGLGLDLNWDRDEEIGFSVINGGTDISPGAHSLAGTYIGGKASVTLGIGAGAAALIGGSNDSIALQPIALERSSGFGVAGGVAYLTLESDAPMMRDRTDPSLQGAPSSPQPGSDGEPTHIAPVTPVQPVAPTGN